MDHSLACVLHLLALIVGRSGRNEARLRLGTQRGDLLLQVVNRGIGFIRGRDSHRLGILQFDGESADLETKTAQTKISTLCSCTQGGILKTQPQLRSKQALIRGESAGYQRHLGDRILLLC